MEVIFYAKCQRNTYFFKNLIEILSQNSPLIESADKKSIKQACFKLTQEGLELYSDTKRYVTVSSIMLKSSFEEYNYKDTEPLCIGISMDILKNCFKYVHRNDEITMKISTGYYDNFPTTIDFLQNENKGFSIKFNIVQNFSYNNFDTYSHVLKLPSPTFTNLYKELGGIKKKVEIFAETNQSGDKIIKFSTNLVDIAVNWIVFPTTSNFEIPCRSSVKSEFLKIASKIGNFSDYVDVFINKDGDILVQSKMVDNMGSVSINIINLTTVINGN